MRKCPELGILNFASGLKVIRRKIPEFLQNDWRKIGQAYEDKNREHPPFKFFTEFINSKSRQFSNKNYETIREYNYRGQTRVLQTEVARRDGRHHKEKEQRRFCQFHNSGSHWTRECKELGDLPFKDRKAFIYEYRLCYRCLDKHYASNCSASLECAVCRGPHATALHRESWNDNESPSRE